MRSSIFAGLVGVSAVGAVKPLVDVSYSKYQGVSLENGITQWLGVRFAAPPVGNLRFAAPQDPVKNKTTIVADTFGNTCLGTGSAASNTSSEDCLFMNIYSPSNATTGHPLPVYFFIQGGGFNTNSNPNYNGTGLIEASNHNIVVVNFNYRVGPYGFLASEEITKGGSTNNGLKDQIKALQWVQKNIRKFGGDPDHVVLGGASAGAASITLLLTAHNGRNDGLFHATAAESQSFAAVRSINESQFMYDNLVIRTGCVDSKDTLACLRGLNATYLQSKNINTPFPGAQNPPLYMYGPTLDNDVVSDLTMSAYRKGNFIKLPAIYGDDTNEGTVFVPANTSSIGESNTFLKDQFPLLTTPQLKQINALYPNNASNVFPNSGAWWRQASDAYGELRYNCPGINVSDIYAATFSRKDIWNYHWDVIDPVAAAAGRGVTHTVEINAIWGPENTRGNAPVSYSTTNAAIVPVTQAYWTSFIRSFDPNTYRLKGSPMWEAWTQGQKQRLHFVTNATAMENVDAGQKARCEYLSSIALDIKQ
ncbi:alpha/beta-hydrolase [Aureobasidium pullulans]|uniref:Carboxylic ester hydrolase n=1 Tax=Aureobasidium pullulans TaxID=5580 RepID=A0A4S9X0K8_AURPU|nr:alpha/beta-hydrolase [Aureobasidium pullulans]